jgi:C_GCAxxG_C_C family probable redox protein
MSVRSQRAVELFNSGASCSQSIVTAYADMFGINAETAMRLSCGFGGGVGRMREVCGVISGMAMLAGLKLGSTSPDDTEGKKRTYETIQKMADEYKKRFGSIICRDLLASLKPGTEPKPSPRTETYYKERPCAKFVEAGAEILERVLLEAQ